MDVGSTVYAVGSGERELSRRDMQTTNLTQLSTAGMIATLSACHLEFT